MHVRADVTTEGLVIPNVDIKRFTFIEEQIIVPLQDIQHMLALITPTKDLLIKLCKCFRSSIYKRDIIINSLKLWCRVDSDIEANVNDIINEHYSKEFTRCNNDWFFTIAEYLADVDINEALITSKIMVDKRNDVHDFHDNTTFTNFIYKTYEPMEVHKLLSDMRYYIAVDNGDDNEGECYHLRVTLASGKIFMRNYNCKNKKHMQNFKNELSNVKPFKMNNNITLFDVFNKWKEYFVYV